MTEKEISELYTRLAFQYESSIDSLLERRIIDADIANASREKFYDSLNEEKLRTSKRIRNYQETIRLYMRLMTCKDNGIIDRVGKAIFRRISQLCHSKLDA